MKRYKHIFFDLDHTLWDFHTNSRDTLRELHGELRLADHGITNVEELIATYEDINEALWGRYAAGRLPKAVLRVLRFRNTLAQFGVKEEALSTRMSQEYVARSPFRTALMPGALDLLRDLRPHYGLHVITNGFEEVQHIKLEHSGIGAWVDVVMTSELAGARKPHPKIFAKALGRAGGRVEEALMVGDSRDADMLGARNSGWDHAHYAKHEPQDEEATYRLKELEDLRAILL